MKTTSARHYWLLLIGFAISVLVACSGETTNADAGSSDSATQIPDALTQG